MLLCYILYARFHGETGYARHIECADRLRRDEFVGGSVNHFSYKRDGEEGWVVFVSRIDSKSIAERAIDIMEKFGPTNVSCTKLEMGKEDERVQDVDIETARRAL